MLTEYEIARIPDLLSGFFPIRIDEDPGSPKWDYIISWKMRGRTYLYRSKFMFCLDFRGNVIDMERAEQAIPLIKHIVGKSYKESVTE